MDNPFALPLRPDIVLSNGIVCSHTYMDNGAQHVTTSRNDEMTAGEWDEYCDKLAAQNRADRKAMHDRQVARNHASFARYTDRNERD